MHYLYLALAILAEVIATTSLKATEGFTRLLPSIVVVIGYSISFYMLTLAIKKIPIGIAYAIWGGLGIVLVAFASYLFYQQKVDLPAVIGMTLIIAGIVVINAFSQMSVH